MLTVCTDEESQRHWMPPARSSEFNQMFLVPVMGMAFRIWLGRVIPIQFEQVIFFPSDGRPVFSRECWDVLGPMFDGLFQDDAPTL
jgi:hypothetical protein